MGEKNKEIKVRFAHDKKIKTPVGRDKSYAIK